MANFTAKIAFGIFEMTAFGVVVDAATTALNFASLINFDVYFVDRGIPSLTVCLLYL